MSGTYVAFGEGYPKYFEYLIPQTVLFHYKRIKKYLADEWKRNKKNNVLEIESCLEKFNAVLLQIYRLYKHQKTILGNAIYFVDSKRDLTMAMGQEEACYDFESLLFQCRSSLDILIWFILRAHSINAAHSSTFTTFRKKLNYNFSPKERDQYLSVLDQCKWLESFMISRKDNTVVRDSIAHYSSYNQKTEYVFNIVALATNEIVITDMESLGVPLFTTAWELSKYIPFVILNYLSFHTIKEPLLLSDCTPKWKNLTVRISMYLENQDNNSLKTNHIRVAKSLNPGSFTFRTDNYANELLDMKIYLLKVTLRRKREKIKAGWNEIVAFPDHHTLLYKQASSDAWTS
jgi:hypothetical protein